MHSKLVLVFLRLSLHGRIYAELVKHPVSFSGVQLPPASSSHPTPHPFLSLLARLQYDILICLFCIQEL